MFMITNKGVEARGGQGSNLHARAAPPICGCFREDVRASLLAARFETLARVLALFSFHNYPLLCFRQHVPGFLFVDFLSPLFVRHGAPTVKRGGRLVLCNTQTSLKTLIHLFLRP